MRVLLISFLIFCIPSIIFSQTRDYKKYDKALKYLDQDKVGKAEELCLKLIEESPEWKNPFLLLSSIYKNQGDIDKAADVLLKIYDLESIDNHTGIKDIGLMYYENGLYRKALYYLEIAFQNCSSLSSYEDAENQVCRFKNRFTNRWVVKSLKEIIENCSFSIKSIEKPIDFITQNLGKNINSPFAEYLPAISVKGDLLIITRRLEEEFGDNEDFFVSSRDDNGNWSPAIRLDKPLNTPLNEGALTYSPNKKILVFTACNRRDGFGSCDLYYSSSEYSWKKVMNLGSNINSKKWDSQACFSPDGKYLYFVSNREGGYGGRDIWVSKISNGDFEKPYNLGPKINTKNDEMSPFIHADNLTLYFASNGHIGMGDYDLFVSRRSNAESEWHKPENLGYPINNHLTQNSLIVDPDGKTAYYASDENGYGKEDIFSFLLPENLSANQVSSLELEIISNKTGEEIILNSVNFSHNSYVISDESFSELEILSNYLKKNLLLKIMIEGHTDNVGDKISNKILSENRAESVYLYLLKSGIHDSRLSFQGYGETRPIDDNNTKEGRAKNRRTSFKIIE